MSNTTAATGDGQSKIEQLRTVIKSSEEENIKLREWLSNVEERTKVNTTVHNEAERQSVG